jgi:S1-C subfamily serine protease
MNVQQVPRGTGTGFVWDERGHIVTNFHVIQGANGATGDAGRPEHLRRPAGRRLCGPRPGRAAHEAPKDKLPPIALGTSRDLQVGQRVYAIGNPFGLDQTLTTGIVSALNREIESFNSRTIRGVIQTDAAINPGNSGGPLLDSAGRLIGVNTQIASPSGASAGIGFAIPADEVNRIVPRLIRDGRFVRPALGVTAGPVELTRSLQLPKGVAGRAHRPWTRPRPRPGWCRSGAARAANRSPATSSLAINDEPVDGPGRHAGACWSAASRATTVTLSVWRNGQARRQAVVLAAAP